MTDPRALLAQLPRTLTHSGQMDGMDELGEALRMLSIQGLVLAVREWFAEHPEIDQAFEVHMDGIRKITPKHPEEMTPALRVAVEDLCQRLMTNNPFGEIQAPARLVLMMNVLSWNRSQVDNILGAVAAVEGKIPAAALFAGADAATLQAQTDPNDQPGSKPRL